MPYSSKNFLQDCSSLSAFPESLLHSCGRLSAVSETYRNTATSCPLFWKACRTPATCYPTERKVINSLGSTFQVKKILTIFIANKNIYK